MKLNQKGFGLVEGLMIAVLLAVVGFGGYYVWNENQDSESSEGERAVVSEDSQTSDSPKFYDDVAMYSLDYPESWMLERTVEDSGYGDGSQVSTVELIAPTGLTMTLEHNFGGRGGYCEPAESDTPHSPTNTCETSEVIFAEKLEGTVLALNSEREATQSERFEDVGVYLVRTKKSSESTKYSIGLNESKDPIVINMPFMGLVMLDRTVLSYYSASDFDPPVSTTGAYIDVVMSEVGDDEAYFDRSDVKEAEDILRSFRVSGSN
jgi:hypothetical protein